MTLPVIAMGVFRNAIEKYFQIKTKQNFQTQLKIFSLPYLNNEFILPRRYIETIENESHNSSKQ